ncbi:MAG: tRNA pseudouridine(38-40) synthase TruA [Verrucomicrobiales bacterium]|nr:tRNA pseudouridine(38-40) synthase TruA [Verrucomicrobiales bacterium]
MKKIRLLLAYDGTSFKGWQSQPCGNTVQDRLEKAVLEITGNRVRVHGSGRTDTGVHALGQVAHFELPENNRMDAGEWQRALNASLPSSVRILRAEPAAEDFHARFSALGKTYLYEIDCGAVFHPLRCGRAWHHPGPLDSERLKAACALYSGEHDFTAFAANRSGDQEEHDMTRVITMADVSAHSGKVVITFSGNGFLYKMVRLLVGGAVRVAEQRQSLDWIRDLLARPGHTKCQYCAPAAGLYLKEVEYPVSA